MMLSERLTGLSLAALSSDALEQEVMRGSQALRTHQSQLSLVLVVVVGLAYYVSFDERTDALALGLWLGAIVLTTVVRSWVCVRMEPTLETAGADALMRNETVLFFSGVTMPAIIGTGYWFVCLPGDERTVFAITLLSAMYSIGSTINSMAQVRLLPILLLVNLGQGVVFFLGLGNRDEPAIALLLAAIIVLELGFARRNSAFFRESARIRLENVERNRQLKENQALVESALESALEASRSKSRFLAAASHDLRQPLHALTLYLGSLRADVESERQAELTERIGDAADQLRENFDALLDLSTFDAGGMVVAPREVALRDVLERSLESVRPQAAEKGLALTCDAPSIRLSVDPMLLGRLLDNLLGNAVRYTDAGEVTLRASEGESGSHLLIEVQDTGIGIPDEHRRRIFDDFAQLDNPARRHGEGSGLGLAIVRRIAALLDAKIDLESVPGTGSRFRVTLPLEGVATTIDDERPNVARHATRNERLGLQGHTFLLVDDEPRVLDALCDFVDSRDGETIAASTWADAARALDERAIDFAIVDDMLGEDRGGLELAVRIADEHGRENVIVVTGSESPRRMREIHERGISVFRKPVTVEQLERIIGERLGLTDTTPDA